MQINKIQILQKYVRMYIQNMIIAILYNTSLQQSTFNVTLEMNKLALIYQTL